MKNAAVQRARFWVELDGGGTIEGKLDTAGKAVVPDLQAQPKRMCFGPDERPYQLVDQTPNPAYDESFDADALVARRYGGNGGEPGGA